MQPIAPDLLRALAVLGLVPAVLQHGGVGFMVMFLVVGGCVLPRALGSPAWFDTLFCATLLLAVWAALLDWYVSLPALDLAVHALTTGLVGALAWQLIDRAGLLVPHTEVVRARRAALLVTVMAATTLAVLWEIGEWLGHTYLDRRIQVGQSDTATDLVAGIVGAVLAGLLVARAWVVVPRGTGTHDLLERELR